jgi:multicomponent Na+:H+ antiporter subunit E
MKNIFNKAKALQIVTHFAVFFIAWCLMSGIYTPFLIICGIFSSAYCVALLHILKINQYLSINMRGLKYITTLMQEIFKSSISLVQLIVAEAPQFASAIKTIKFKNLTSTTNIVMQANAITMTPGTVVIAVCSESSTMLVHAIDKQLLAGIPAENINKIVNS